MALDCGCPEHYPDWDGQDIDLGGQAMLALKTTTFLHMPMGHETHLGQIRYLINNLELKAQWPEFVMSRTGWLRGQMLAPLEEADSPSRHITHLESPFHLRVKLHQGDIGTIKKSVKEVQASLLDSGRVPKELYLSYLTCPNCQEKRGGDKIMLLRRWQTSAMLAKRVNKQ